MTNCKYEICEEKIQSEENEIYISYGIRFVDFDGNIIAKVSDVSSDCNFVEKVCKILNDNDVSVVHMADIIIDVIAEEL